MAITAVKSIVHILLLSRCIVEVPGTSFNPSRHTMEFSIDARGDAGDAKKERNSMMRRAMLEVLEAEQEEPGIATEKGQSAEDLVQPQAEAQPAADDDATAKTANEAAPVTSFPAPAPAAPAPEAVPQSSPSPGPASVPQPFNLTTKFYLYELPKSLNAKLVSCYKKYTGKNVWEDFREEKGQNTADIWIHRLLERHALRTWDPKEAGMFYIPFYGFLSSFFSGYKSASTAGRDFSAMGSCGGKSHIHRILELQRFLDASSWFTKKPEAHMMAVSFWAVARENLLPLYAPPSVVTGPLFQKLQKSVLLVYEPKFSSMAQENEYQNWPGKLVTIPYVAKPSLVEHELNMTFGRRNISFFFQGSLHKSSDKNHNGLAGRQELAKAFEGTPGSMIVDTFKHYTGESYESGMTHASFCLVLEGDTPTSARLFDSIAAGCVPLILSDGISLPFGSQVDWNTFSVHPWEGAYKAADKDMKDIAVKLDAVRSESISDLNDMPEERLASLQKELTNVREWFVYGRGTPEGFTAGAAIDHILVETARAMNLIGAPVVNLAQQTTSV